MSNLTGPASVGEWVCACQTGEAGAAEWLARRATRLALRTAAAVLSSREEAGEPAEEPRDLDGVLAARQELQRGLAKLPAQQQFALVLRYVHDLSDEDIAAALECRPGTVHSLLSRGRVALRRHIGRDLIVEAVAGGDR